MKKVNLIFVIALFVIALASCSKDDNSTNNEIAFKAISSVSQISGTWGRPISGGYEYWMFNSDGKNGTYVNTGKNANQFDFTYIIDPADKYLIDYTKKIDNTISKIGIGIYEDGDLMIGSERFTKVK